MYYLTLGWVINGLPTHSPWFDYQVIFYEEYKSRCFSSCNFLHPSINSSLLHINIPLGIPPLKHPRFNGVFTFKKAKFTSYLKWPLRCSNRITDWPQKITSCVFVCSCPCPTRVLWYCGRSDLTCLVTSAAKWQWKLHPSLQPPSISKCWLSVSNTALLLYTFNTIQTKSSTGYAAAAVLQLDVISRKVALCRVICKQL
jgi:hypothetical protein